MIILTEHLSHVMADFGEEDEDDLKMLEELKIARPTISKQVDDDARRRLANKAIGDPLEINIPVSRIMIEGLEDSSGANISELHKSIDQYMNFVEKGRYKSLPSLGHYMLDQDIKFARSTIVVRIGFDLLDFKAGWAEFSKSIIVAPNNVPSSATVIVSIGSNETDGILMKYDLRNFYYDKNERHWTNKDSLQITLKATVVPVTLRTTVSMVLTRSSFVRALFASSPTNPWSDIRLSIIKGGIKTFKGWLSDPFGTNGRAVRIYTVGEMHLREGINCQYSGGKYIDDYIIDTLNSFEQKTSGTKDHFYAIVETRNEPVTPRKIETYPQNREGALPSRLWFMQHYLTSLAPHFKNSTTVHANKWRYDPVGLDIKWLIKYRYLEGVLRDLERKLAAGEMTPEREHKILVEMRKQYAEVFEVASSYLQYRVTKSVSDAEQLDPKLHAAIKHVQKNVETKIKHANASVEFECALEDSAVVYDMVSNIHLQTFQILDALLMDFSTVEYVLNLLFDPALKDQNINILIWTGNAHTEWLMTWFDHFSQKQMWDLKPGNLLESKGSDFCLDIHEYEPLFE